MLKQNQRRDLLGRCDIGEEVHLDRLWKAKERACAMTHIHEIRVGEEVRALARHLGWDRSSIEDFAHAASFHDVGKMLTPRHVLWKSSALDEAEMETMRRHAEDGAGILGRFGGTIGDVGVDMAHYHHERPDGRGYYGLRAGDIPACARICAVADVFEAVTSDARAYRSSMSVGSALIMMTRTAPEGRMGRAAFDHAVLHGFVELKLGAPEIEMSRDEREMLMEFVQAEKPSRKAEIAAFRLLLDRATTVDNPRLTREIVDLCRDDREKAQIAKSYPAIALMDDFVGVTEVAA